MWNFQVIITVDTKPMLLFRDFTLLLSTDDCIPPEQHNNCTVREMSNTSMGNGNL